VFSACVAKYSVLFHTASMNYPSDPTSLVEEVIGVFTPDEIRALQSDSRQRGLPLAEYCGEILREHVARQGGER
jgi:hypothetical protein